MDDRLVQLTKLKRDKHEQLVASTAGQLLVCVKGGQPVVVTAEDVEEYRSFESAAHGFKVENEEECSESIVFD